jgi:hypothetical protein
MINEVSDITHLLHTIFWPAFLCFLVYRTTMPGFRDFCSSLNQPGAHILIAYVLLITGILMMKIMLYDDGKYIVGGAVGILAKSLTGVAEPPHAPTETKTEIKT